MIAWMSSEPSHVWKGISEVQRKGEAHLLSLQSKSSWAVLAEWMVCERYTDFSPPLRQPTSLTSSERSSKTSIGSASDKCFPIPSSRTAAMQDAPAKSG